MGCLFHWVFNLLPGLQLWVDGMEVVHLTFAQTLSNLTQISMSHCSTEYFGSLCTTTVWFKKSVWKSTDEWNIKQRVLKSGWEHERTCKSCQHLRHQKPKYLTACTETFPLITQNSDELDVSSCRKQVGLPFRLKWKCFGHLPWMELNQAVCSVLVGFSAYFR